MKWNFHWDDTYRFHSQLLQTYEHNSEESKETADSRLETFRCQCIQSCQATYNSVIYDIRHDTILVSCMSTHTSDSSISTFRNIQMGWSEEIFKKISSADTDRMMHVEFTYLWTVGYFYVKISLRLPQAQKGMIQLTAVVASIYLTWPNMSQSYWTSWRQKHILS